MQVQGLNITPVQSPILLDIAGCEGQQYWLNPNGTITENGPWPGILLPSGVIDTGLTGGIGPNGEIMLYNPILGCAFNTDLDRLDPSTGQPATPDTPWLGPLDFLRASVDGYFAAFERFISNANAVSPDNFKVNMNHVKLLVYGSKIGPLAIVDAVKGYSENGISGVVKSVLSTTAGILLGAGAVGLLGATAPAILVGVVVAGAAIAATIAVNEVWDNWSSIEGWIQDTWEAGKDILEDFYSDAADWFGDKWDSLADGLADFLNNLQQQLTDAAGDISDFFDRLESGILDSLLNLSKNLSDFFSLFGINSPGQLGDNINSLFNMIDRAANPPRDPLVFDLNGNGIETVGVNAGVLFDHNGDGIRHGTGWVAPTDGLLVWDRNGNGMIDSGQELFGDNHRIYIGTPSERNARDGFEALRFYDRNENDLNQRPDGVIDHNDAIFAELKIWRDLNQDGISQANELFSLADLGIKAIHLNNQRTGSTQNGNRIDSTASFEWSDGSTGEVASLFFAANNFRNEFADSIPLTVRTKVLPDFSGSGGLRSLREAATLDDALADLIEQYAAATTRAEQDALVDDILWQWHLSSQTDTRYSKYSSLSRNGGYGLSVRYSVDKLDLAGKTSVIEAFNGRLLTSLEFNHFGTNYQHYYFMPTMAVQEGSWLHTAQLNTIAAIETAYEQLRQQVHLSLMMQTRLKPVMEAIDFTIAAGGLVFDFSAMQDKLTELVQENPQDGMADLFDFVSLYSSLLFRHGWNFNAFLTELENGILAEQDPEGNWKHALNGAQLIDVSEDVTIYRGGNTGLEIIRGHDNRNQLYGNGGNDILIGGAGNDHLYGGAGDDVLIGGAGNDDLHGGAGSDVYWFERGWGYDRIHNYDTGTDKTDAIVFAAGIAPDEIRITRSGLDLILTLAGSSDRITVQRYFDNDGDSAYKLEEIRFADGTVWDIAQVKMMVMQGTEGNDTLYGYATDDVLHGGAGNDTLYGGAGDDELHGDDGDDYLDGGAGSDVYWFERGWGQDRIHNYDTGTDKTDAIVFADGIAPDEIRVTRSGTDLILTLAGSTDRITVNHYFDSDGDSAYKLEEIRFADGTVWDIAQVKMMVMQGTEGNDTLFGYATDDVLHGGVGNDQLFGEAGDDSLYGGTGNDHLYGGAGDDMLEGGAGDDRLYGEDGDDILIGGTGNDYLVGGAGSDVYWFDRDWGQDTILNWDNGTDKTDAIVFAESIAPDEIRVTRSGNDLILALSGSTDQITVHRYFQSDGNSANKLEEIRFADGTVWDIAQVKAIAIQGTDGNDHITGHATDDVIHGGAGDDILFGGAGDDELHGEDGDDHLYGEAGNDYLYGGDGDDRLYGGDGDDRLYGGAGNDHLDGGDGDDFLVGGTGNDYLQGGAGSDIYWFDRGWGQDTIFNWDSGTDKTDAIVFAEGIAPDEIRVTRSGTHLILALSGSTDQITVHRYFQSDGNSAYKLEEIRFADGTVWDIAQVKALAIQGTDGDDTLYGYSTDDVMHGGAGDDRLHGGDGDDILIGGTGNDYLEGGAGSDVYWFDRNWGRDTINNYDTGTEKTDAIVFAEGIAPDEIRLTREGLHLVLTLDGSSDQITVPRYFQNDGNSAYKLEEIRFADGTVWDIAQVKAIIIQGTDGDDTLRGYATDDVIHGGAGNDTIYGDAGDDELHGGDGDDELYGGAGNDRLYGGAGNDRLNGDAGDDYLYGGDGDDHLYGGTGDDVLVGGAGNDYLSGGSGSDVYWFDRSWGQDTINNYDTGTDKTDALVFAEGITPDEIRLTRSGTELILLMAGRSDRITVKHYFQDDGNSEYKLEEIRFADGTVWDIAQVLTMSMQGTGGDDRLHGLSGDDVIHGGAGDDYIYDVHGNNQLFGGDGNDHIIGTGLLDGGAGDDVLEGGGSDTLRGGDGNDTLIAYSDAWTRNNNVLEGGKGNDTLYGSFGDDTYIFNQGDGHDLIIERREGEAYSNVTPSFDTLQFGENIKAEDLIFIRQGKDLLIHLPDDSDSITVQNWFAGSAHYKLNLLTFTDGTTLTTAQVEARLVTLGTSGADTLFGDLHKDNVIYGEGGDDYIDGQGGNNRLYGGMGNDTLVSGTGNDLLVGGAGDDKYVFKPGCGQNIIDNQGGGFDGIFFTNGLNVSRLSFSRDGDDLLILIDQDDAQSVRVLNHFLGGDAAISYVQPSGGSMLTAAQIASAIAAAEDEEEQPTDPQEPTDPEQPVNPNPDGSFNPGLGGNDQLTGTSGNDVLLGGAGDDVLSGLAGNDLLFGGTGDDTYIYRAGRDRITEQGGNDKLIFSNGITFNQVASGLSKSGNDLVLRVNGSMDDSVTLTNFFLGGDHLVERIEFESGGAITAAQIFGAFGLSVPSSGAAASNVLYAPTGGGELPGTAGDDVLIGSHGHDTLRGGAGNDLLIGGRGNDTYIVGAGDGQTIIDNRGGGDDVLRFEGISFNQVASGLMKSGNDLVLNIGGSSDKVTIKDWFLGGDNVIPLLQFASGGQITANQIFGAFGLSNPNPQRSLAYGDLPDERAFTTVYVGSAGAETIYGSSGDDFIDGGDGNDVIRPGGGNDYLLGGRGNDIYLFGRSAGHSIINNYDPGAGRQDVLRFEAGILPGEVTLIREGDHLLVQLTADNSIKVLNYFAQHGNSAYRLDEIQFADGTTWYYQQVQQLTEVSGMMQSADRQAMQLIDALNSFDSNTDDDVASDFVAVRLETEQLVY